MYLDSYCPGCGGGEGNQSCKIARCSLSHGKVEYCSQCEEFPCEQYRKEDEFDSFITHRNRMRDLKKAEQMGTEAYQAEQREKMEILDFLLTNYNDGRKKTFFCLTVNLLELADLKKVLEQIKGNGEIQDLPLKEKAAHASKLFQDMADQRQIVLKLRKKPAKSGKK